MEMEVRWLKLRGFGGRTLDMQLDKVTGYGLARAKFGSFAFAAQLS